MLAFVFFQTLLLALGVAAQTTTSEATAAASSAAESSAADSTATSSTTLTFIISSEGTASASDSASTASASDSASATLAVNSTRTSTGTIPTSTTNSTNSTSPENEYPFTTDGSCGSENGRMCLTNGTSPCCSKDGYCGTGDDYCSKPDCQEDYGKCQSNDGTLGFPHCSWADSGTSPRCDGKCGSAFNNAICDTSAKADAFAIYGVYNYGGCCSSGGFCGSTSDHCQQGCQSGCDEGYGPAAASSSAAAAATSASAAEQLDMPPSGFMIAFFSVLGMVLGL